MASDHAVGFGKEDHADWAIRVHDVQKWFRAPGRVPTLALDGVNLTAREGEFIVILGPSGCGKTTLLRVIAGLETPTAGDVELFGEPVSGPTTKASVLFQSAVLLPWRTIMENVMLPAEIRRIRKAVLTDRAKALLATAGLAGFEDHYPRELSGGMRQRAALCRAMLLDPPLLFMDEPFGALDAITRGAMNRELFEIWQRTGKTVIFVTHDISEAVRLGTRVIVMSPRPGRVAGQVDIDIEESSFHARVAGARYHELVVTLEQAVATLATEPPVGAT